MPRVGALDVVVDMGALGTNQTLRGIGVYVGGLCDALAHCETDLHVGGMTNQFQPDAIGTMRDRLRSQDSDLSRAAERRHKKRQRWVFGTRAYRTGASLLHLPDPYGTPIDPRVPRVVTCHDLIPTVLHEDYLPRFPGRHVQRLRDHIRYRTARRVIAISEHTKRDLIEHVGIAPDRVDVVHLGVDHGRFHTTAGLDEKADVSRFLGFEGPYILYVGAGDIRKNLPLLIRAYHRSGLSGAVPLVLAGHLNSSHLAPVEAAIADEGVDDVHVCGYVDDALIAALYRGCLAHVFPSSYEGFGLTPLEAMACGAPTICHRVSSLTEVVGDAVLAPEQMTADSLSASLVTLVEDIDLQTSLRARGLERAREFTWERCAQGTIASYRRALQS